LTPEHVIRIKPFPAIIDEDVDAGIDTFVKEYREYFEKYASKEHICLDPAPRYAVIRGVGAITFGKDEKEAKIIADIVEHTLKAMLIAEELGGWQSLSPKELFDMEYWELEQNKIKNSG
jgi:rhamnose utilization protein RhaD (predicted bifunctional aldolase and dehydrogenase)